MISNKMLVCMESVETILKAAKLCHTKEAWANFYRQYGESLILAKNTRLITELFRLLRNDPQSLQYDPALWEHLIRACSASWNLDLGIEIIEFCQKIPSPCLAVASAQLLMESGAPLRARDLANRAARLKNIEPRESLQLQMIVANSFVEQGKIAFAVRLLEKMAEVIDTHDLALTDLAELVNNMGRAHFFMGRYPAAAHFFKRSYGYYLELQNWEGAAKAIFNTAACFHNTGTPENKTEAFRLLDECRNLATKHRLVGPLSHCLAFRATDEFQHGHFHEAAKDYRQALELLPASENSFRRLHILSMLAFTYLKLGKYQNAFKIGKKTIELAKLDKSERFRARYISLHAELYWEEGHIGSSQKLLEGAIKTLSANGVNTLEELSALSRYYLQSAKLNDSQIATNFRISDQLQNASISWLEYQCALAELYLTKKQYDACLQVAKECHAKAKASDIRYFCSLSLLSMLGAKLAQNQLDADFFKWKEEFEQDLPDKGSPLAGFIKIINAAIAYRNGDLPSVIRFLNEAQKHRRLFFPYHIVIQSWLATLEGHSPKLNAEHLQVVARATSVYFAPSLVAVDQTTFKVSQRYTVNLENQPMLAKVLHHLLATPGHLSTNADMQKHIWKQSLASVGWQQKIRNTIMRLRECFPTTIAPLIIHMDNQIRLFYEAIDLARPQHESLNSEQMVLKLLEEESMSSSELANRIQISQATTKRILKKLADAKQIHMTKTGRQVMYTANVDAVDLH